MGRQKKAAKKAKGNLPPLEEEETQGEETEHTETETDAESVQSDILIQASQIMPTLHLRTRQPRNRMMRIEDQDTQETISDSQDLSELEVIFLNLIIFSCGDETESGSNRRFWV